MIDLLSMIISFSFFPFVSLLPLEKHYGPHYFWHFKFILFSFDFSILVIFPFVKGFFIFNLTLDF